MAVSTCFRLGAGTRDVLDIYPGRAVLWVGGNNIDSGSGDFMVGTPYHQLKIGIATNGAEAGVVRLRAAGGIGEMRLGVDTNDVLVVHTNRVTVPILEVTAGADLAEPFRVGSCDAAPPGTVMIIDGERPGQLKPSEGAYDHRVAGVVSGAGGLRPGICLTQAGSVEGSVPVALSGRAYARADTSNGPIRPGDLLTTSEQPGRAMRATDPSRAHGALLGKAMTPLESGEGLVLVLVNLH